MRPLRLLAILLSGILALASCSEDEECQSSRSMLSVRVLENGQDVTDTIPNLTVRTLKTDSVIINQDENVTSMSLPLSYTDESTAFVLDYLDGTYDTLTLTHSNTPFFVSPDCGFEMRQEILSAGTTHTLIDHLEIMNSTLPSSDEENLQIYLK